MRKKIKERMEHAEALTALLREIFKQKNSGEWLQLLKHDQGLPIDRVATCSDLLHDEHLAMNRVVAPPVDDIGITQIINDPVNVRGVKKVGAKHAPDLGQHNVDILGELGFSADDIKSLKSKGVI